MRRGVGIFVRKDLNYQVINVKNSIIKGVIESLWIKLETASGTKIIGNCYRPNTAPLASVSEFNIAMEEILYSLKKKFSKANLIVAGDFNIDLFKNDSHSLTTEFLTLMFGYGLMPLITKPTRITHSSYTLIDNIFTDDNCSSTGGLVSTDISDHEALFMLDTSILHLNKLQVKSRCTRPENMSRLKSKLLDYDFSDIVNNSDTLTAFSGFFLSLTL